MHPKKHEAHMSNDARIAVVETTILNINSVMLDIKNKLNTLESKIDTKIDALENKMDSKFDSLQNRLWSNFLWTMGMMIGLAGLIAHTQHWI
jgi:hypothetical protein